MHKFIIYSFRTFPDIEALKKIDPDITILGKLKEDIQLLFQQIEVEKPEYVIGVAIGKRSVLEEKAVNVFNKNKKVISDAPNFYTLSIPSFFPFPSSLKRSSSFCNWSMFQIAHFINTHHLATKVSFVHISLDDISKLTELLNS